MSNRSRKGLELVTFAVTLGALVFSLSLSIGAQHKIQSGPAPKMVKAGGQTATLTASLVDPEKNAREKTATVEVRVTGVKLIDPALTNKLPTKGQGHLHYRVDDGPVVATPTSKLSFHDLTPGKHQIVVVLANNDHSPAGPQQTLEITVP